MRIAIGCDPTAEAFKKELIGFVKSLGHEVCDFGSEDTVYANVAFRVGEAVATKKYDKGILICGTGIGVCIAANKVKGCYAALVSDIYQAQRAALSNNANVITMGAQVIGIEHAKCLVKEFLSLTFDPASRSKVKIERIAEYESA